MNKRDKRLTDYGVPENKIEWLYEHCQALDDYEYLILKYAALTVCPAKIVDDILLSLTEGASYYVLRVIGRAHIGKNDFYAYRRKTLAEFYHILEGDIT